MFTGIIEDIGQIQNIKDSCLTVISKLSDIKVGDSIAVNGICLTGTSLNESSGKKLITFDFSPETKEHTTISFWKRNGEVNLERALKVGERLGGHFVTGHIDGVGKIIKITKKDNSVIYEIKVDRKVAPFFVKKGSVAIDGISLTIIDCSDDKVSVSIIPHTLKETVLKGKSIGDKVNIETDILAKHVAKLLSTKSSGLTKEMLINNGFL